MSNNVYKIFQEAAVVYPHHIAIIEKDWEISFGDLLQAVEQTAAQLKAQGLGPGDRVLVFVPMGINLYRVVLALFKIGAAAVFLDEWVSWQRMTLCCQLADCRGFIGVWKARVMGWFAGPVRRISVKPSLSGYQNYAPDPDIYTAKADHPALITFTTGSTGTPKAALRSHSFLRQQFEVLREELNPQPGDVNMTVLPIVLLINLGAGATSVIAAFKASQPDALDAGLVTRQMTRYGVRCLTASPFFVRKIAEYCLDHSLEIPTLTSIFTGGAPVFPAEAAILTQAFPATTIRIAYGSTEAEPISTIEAAEVAGAAGQNQPEALPVGRINGHIAVKIIPVSDQSLEWTTENPLVECLPGEVGEIVVAGPHVLAAYYNNPEALRRQKIYAPNGTVWHRTGDSGFLKNGNQLYLTGRCSTLFVHLGRLICPFLYEGWLQQLPGVAIGTVLGREGRMVFCVEMQPNAEQTDVRQAIAALHILDSDIRFVEKIPRDPRHHSKIDYQRVVEVCKK